MKVIKIDKNKWTKGLDTARESYQLFGPVKIKENHCFAPLKRDQQPDMTVVDTVLSPKSTVFPQTEKLMTATLDTSKPNHHLMERADTDYSPRAVIGIRPFDARAIDLVKLNFDTKDHRDPYWCDAHDATTFVGLAVNTPSQFDFSTSMDSGPFDEKGLDVLLVDMDTGYLAKILTPKGEAFMACAGFNREATAGDLQKMEELKKAAEQAITTQVETDNLREKSLLDLHQAPFWDDVAFSCINCGTCTFVCPTCWCFDIQDETKGNNTTRFRNWDSCMSPLFTLHGSGHNPRGEKTQRVRQRFMHKLKYFLDKYDQGTMCVGCGRCVKSCPVNIDIREVCNVMNAYEPQK
ncbi:4Fe-4S dicluster containing protein [Desulfocicer vacuolatum DSM 3385]|uniref:4Fe-4S dicluster containing protein n=1 Tax=Desulfocicer vacuolatum DSM 3385 TaxID=1121400 RepID=A0A1W1ZMA1_9BACT|nr:4Fe-4S dicluster domain-containing protein [Desulfocicer vacuolatum]SMC49680.1 4Fe-4S dicluster containing protein [Desulfocicer vacuolatum DSM 3385]